MKNLSCLTVAFALGGLSQVSAAVVPGDAAFGAKFQNENGVAFEQITVGKPNLGDPTGTGILPFNGPNAIGGAQLSLNTAYTFQLTYAVGAQRSLRFTIKNPANSVIATAEDLDFLGELTPYAQSRINGIYGFYLHLEGFTPLGYAPGNPANWTVATPLTIDAPDILGAQTTVPGIVNSPTDNWWFLPATGLSDGFTLNGQILYTSDIGKGNFEIYAAVPEPATVAFGLALVGGLGLLEIRRRKNS